MAALVPSHPPDRLDKPARSGLARRDRPAAARAQGRTRTQRDRAPPKPSRRGLRLGRRDPQALSAEAVHGFLDAQPEHADVKSAARALIRDDPRLYLDRVRCPTLVVWGARDRLVPLVDGMEYARRLRAPLRVLPATGHLVVGECPKRARTSS